MKSICVFCGSSLGRDPAFENVARELGRELALRKIKLVYGGSNAGLMGAVADSALENGGEVLGVIPGFLKGKEVAHEGLTELIVCQSMHERKMKMFEQSQGFIVLPGGFGTLEEAIEMLTWQQLGLHTNPIVFVNVTGYFDPLIRLFEGMEKSGLLKAENRGMALFTRNLTETFNLMMNHRAPNVERRMGPAKT